MPLILVVDTDDRVAARVRQALAPEGWNVVHAPGVTEAMQAVASEAPDLFLVASELEGAGKVLSSFARRQGGPGTVALVAEDSAAGAGAGRAGAGGADAGLDRSFGAGELRATVERILKTGDRPPGPAAGEPKLTSQDIFGDLVAEVESGAEGFPPAPATPPSAIPASPASAAHAPPTQPTQPPQPTEPTRATRPRQPAPPKRPAGDEEIERKLEQTLSGVLGWVPKGRPAAAPEAPPPAAGPPRPRRGAEDDVDKLISDTLSGLELPGGRRKRGEPEPPRAPKAPPEAPAKAARPPAREEFGLSDLEALLARPRRTAPAPRPQPAEEPPLRPELAEPEPAPAEPAEAAATPGTEFGQYRLLERIGVGGMAEVWKARMSGVEGFQKTVAIKRILPHLTDSPDFVEMFVDEAKLAAQLNHANVIHIYDLGKIGDDYYIAMEHVEGENLRRILERARERGKPMPVGVALHVAARLASALDHAHRKRDFDGRELGLVHRDVSPQNVLVGYEGTIKLCDFGIVKAVSKSSHTQRGALKGKLQYMSPEQAWGKPLDGRSDIFSVGALLFEMLTGRRLFVGDSEMEVLESVRECRITAPGELVPGIPGEVDAIVLRALAREPEDRFQSAGDLAARIEEVLGAMRPAPGQAELARYLAELFERPPEAGDEEAARPATGAGAAGAALAATPPAVETPAPGRGEAEGPPAAGPEAQAAAPAGAEAGPALVPAVAPVGQVEPEEGGPRGKWLLVAAIVVALVAGGLLAWYLVGRGGEGGQGREPAVEEGGVEAEAAPPALPVEQGDEEPPGGEEPGAAPAEAAAGEAAEDAPPEELRRGIEEQLAEREEALRRQFEAELSARERALQEQLTELQEVEAQPPPPPPPAKTKAPPPAPEPAAPETPVEDVAAPPEAAPAKSAAPEPVAPPPPPPPRPAPAPPASAAPASPVPPTQPTQPTQPTRQPPPEPAVREGALVTMGPGVQPPKLVRFDKPEYPPIARRLRVEDEVVVSVLVDETGKVADTRLVRGASRDVGLDEAALAAARNATFQPATKNGVRVKMWTTLRIPFRL